MSNDPRSHLREALAEALYHSSSSDGERLFQWESALPGDRSVYGMLADAILAVLPEHRDDVLGLVGGCPHVVQGVEGTAFCDLADSSGAALRAENERLTEALRKVEYLGSQAQTNAAVHMGMIARAALSERPSKAQRHQEHYRTCNCLGDSDVCCDPSCCAEPDRLSPKGRFGPTPVGHPSIGDPCRLCGEAIEEGQVPSLVTLGPVDDEEAAKADAGRAYNAVAAVVHEACAYPEPNGWRAGAGGDDSG